MLRERERENERENERERERESQRERPFIRGKTPNYPSLPAGNAATMMVASI